jgi:hypothetical protein
MSLDLHPATVVACITCASGTVAVNLLELGLAIVALLCVLVFLDLYHIWSRCQERKRKIALFRLRRENNGGRS